jgi:hypothetical protein
VKLEGMMLMEMLMEPALARRLELHLPRQNRYLMFQRFAAAIMDFDHSF